MSFDYPVLECPTCVSSNRKFSYWSLSKRKVQNETKTQIFFFFHCCLLYTIYMLYPFRIIYFPNEMSIILFTIFGCTKPNWVGQLGGKPYFYILVKRPRRNKVIKIQYQIQLYRVSQMFVLVSNQTHLKWKYR